MTSSETPLEFSRPLTVTAIGPGTSRVLEATPAECAALARRMDMPSLTRFQAEITVKPARPGGAYRAEGRITAKGQRLCVVSLEPFRVSLTHDFVFRFVTEAIAADVLEAAAAEDPDEVVYDGVTLDLGEAVAEEFALSLDPYPRKPGAVMPAVAEAKTNPFAVLAARFGQPTDGEAAEKGEIPEKSAGDDQK